MPLLDTERTILLKVLVTRLRVERWSSIDSALRQCSIPTSDSSHGSIENYLFTMLGHASDQSLFDLLRHIATAPRKASTPGTLALDLNPSFWQRGMFRVFVSHVAQGRAVASLLQEQLLKHQISCFVAHNDIEPTHEWQKEIESALATCDALVALLHEDFHLSRWTDQEVGFAIGRGIPTVSISFGQAPYGFIERAQAFNGSGKGTLELARELFDTFRKDPRTQPLMAEGLMRLFEKSPTLREARQHVGYLEELDCWDLSFSRRLQEALKTNSQISSAWGVPERVAQLIPRAARAVDLPSKEKHADFDGPSWADLFDP